MENREKLRIPGPAVSLALLMLTYLVARGIYEIIAVLRYQGYSFVYPQSYFEIAAVCLLTGALVILALRYRHGGNAKNWDVLLLAVGANLALHTASLIFPEPFINLAPFVEFALAVLAVVGIGFEKRIGNKRPKLIAKSWLFLSASPILFLLLPLLATTGLTYPPLWDDWSSELEKHLNGYSLTGDLPESRALLGRNTDPISASTSTQKPISFHNFVHSLSAGHHSFSIVTHRRFVDFIDLGLLPKQQLQKWRKLATDPQTGERLSVNVAPFCDKVWDRFKARKEKGEIDAWIVHPFAGHFYYRRHSPSSYELKVFGPPSGITRDFLVNFPAPESLVAEKPLPEFNPCEDSPMWLFFRDYRRS